MATLDGVVQDVGVCGLFQTLLVLASHSTIVVSVCGMMLMAFGSYDPGWVCLDADEVFNNFSAGSDGGRIIQRTDVTPVSTGSAQVNLTDRCALFSTCKNVSFLPGTSTVVSEWGLVCDHKWTPSIIFTVQMVGVLVGAYIAGHIGDCAGRRACLYGMVGLHGVTNLIAVFSTSWQVFAAIRFFIGVAVGGILTTSFVIPLEFTDQFWRGVVGSIPTWNIGAALFSIGVIALKDWRQLHLLTAALSCLAFLPVFWVPESLRWLAVHGHDAKAGAVATKIARMNKRPLPSLEVLEEMAEYERQRAMVDRSERYTYIDLFRDAAVRKTSIIMGLVWVTMAFVYYGISFGIQALSGDYYINFLIVSLMEVPAILSVLPSLSFLSRRWASAFHFFGVSAACLGVLLVILILGIDEDSEHSAREKELKEKLTMALTVIAKLGTIGAWNVVSVSCGELYPTAVRNLGFGYLNALARIGAMLGPVLFPQDPAQLHLAMAGMGTITAVCAGLVLLLPETKGVPLEDMLRSKALLATPESDITFVNGQSGKNYLDEKVEEKSSNVAMMEVGGYSEGLLGAGDEKHKV